MPVIRLSDATWEEIEALDDGLVAILPTGAIEAHGPHLPLATDEIIAEGMAAEGARRIADTGRTVLQLPPLVYSPAAFASSFPGTISIRPETMTELIVEIGDSLARSGVGLLAIANAHLDPVHLGALHRAEERLLERGMTVAFPDLTRKPWAARLTDEFKSGACHAGRFEGSIVMARRPELVREEIQRALEPNPASLSEAIQSGKNSFEEAGGPRAYFGEPGAASRGEGVETLRTLGRILEEAVEQALAGERTGSSGSS